MKNAMFTKQSGRPNITYLKIVQYQLKLHGKFCTVSLCRRGPSGRSFSYTYKLIISTKMFQWIEHIGIKLSTTIKCPLTDMNEVLRSPDGKWILAGISSVACF